MSLMLHEVSLRYRMHQNAEEKLNHDLSKLFKTISFMVPRLTRFSLPTHASANNEISPSSPFQVLNLSNISMDLSTRISLSSTSLETAKFFKRKYSEIESDDFDRITATAYVFSFVNLILSIVAEYNATGQGIPTECLAQWRDLIEPIFSLDSLDDILRGKMVKSLISPVFDRVFPSMIELVS